MVSTTFFSQKWLGQSAVNMFNSKVNMLSMKLFLATWVASFPGHLKFCFLHMRPFNHTEKWQKAWYNSFMMVFTQNSILHWAVHQPIAFHNFEISWGSSNWSLNNYDFISDAIFKICIHRLSEQIRDLTLTWNGATVKTGKQVMTLQCIYAACKKELAI